MSLSNRRGAKNKGRKYNAQLHYTQTAFIGLPPSLTCTQGGREVESGEITAEETTCKRPDLIVSAVVCGVLAADLI